jgi:hypothetical protein
MWRIPLKVMRLSEDFIKDAVKLLEDSGTSKPFYLFVGKKTAEEFNFFEGQEIFGANIKICSDEKVDDARD